MGFFTKKKKIKTLSQIDIDSKVERTVRIERKDGTTLDPADMNDEERRMADLLSVISMAAKTGKFMIGISVYDPEGKLKQTSKGKDIHHYTFAQDFQEDDRYGCLDEFAKLLKLGDK